MENENDWDELLNGIQPDGEKDVRHTQRVVRTFPPSSSYGIHGAHENDGIGELQKWLDEGMIVIGCAQFSVDSDGAAFGNEYILGWEEVCDGEAPS